VLDSLQIRYRYLARAERHGAMLPCFAICSLNILAGGGAKELGLPFHS
jgi:hypothetical protein